MVNPGEPSKGYRSSPSSFSGFDLNFVFGNFPVDFVRTFFLAPRVLVLSDAFAGWLVWFLLSLPPLSSVVAGCHQGYRKQVSRGPLSLLPADLVVTKRISPSSSAFPSLCFSVWFGDLRSSLSPFFAVFRCFVVCFPFGPLGSRWFPLGVTGALV